MHAGAWRSIARCCGCARDHPALQASDATTARALALGRRHGPASRGRDPDGTSRVRRSARGLRGDGHGSRRPRTAPTERCSDDGRSVVCARLEAVRSIDLDHGMITFQRPGAVIFERDGRGPRDGRRGPTASALRAVEHLSAAGLPRIHPARRARRSCRICGQLGIGAAYTSPYFAAQPGSTHGYDVSNHNELNVEVGGSDALRGVHRRAARARSAAHRGFRAEPHGDCDGHEPVVAGRARERAERARRRASSTSTGSR